MRRNRIFLFFLLFLFIFQSGCEKAEATALHSDPNTDNAFLDSITFLGDSTTAHMLNRAPLKDGAASKQIWITKKKYLNLDSRITYEKIVCPENGQEMTIGEAVKLVQPQHLIITLGIDYGVYYYRNDLSRFRFCYEKLLDVIATAGPDTHVMLQSVFPVSRESKVITNEMIDRANEIIRQIATDRGLPYIDSNSVLKDADGYLKKEYVFSEDGIHLTAAAYTAIFDYLSSLEEELRGKL